MKGINITYLIVIVATALIALFGVQLYWVNNAYKLREKQFGQKVNEALTKTAKDIEDKMTCVEIFTKVAVKPSERFSILKQDKNHHPNPATDSVKMYFVDAYDHKLYDFNEVDFSVPVTMELLLKCEFHMNDSIRLGSDSTDFQPMALTLQNYHEKLSANKPIAERIRKRYLDSVLAMCLNNEGINKKYHYGIVRQQGNVLEYKSKGADSLALLQSDMRAVFMNDKYFDQPYFLSIYFDNKNGIVLSTLWGVLLTSALIILILVYAFIYFVKTILRQKKLSEMKTDFINNMTHEFKTPITNISLALETLGDTQLEADKYEVILAIIGEENSRLKENVEKVLQIASLEKEKMDLRPESIDINGLILKVVNQFENRQDEKKISITCELKVPNAVIFADRTHIINILYNLIDNAIKYCHGKPEIIIKTDYAEGGIRFTVTDNGIGMPAEVQKRIFEKFYRAHTGDVHNVKGFGLGLCYVKSIVELHKGSIKVESEQGRGSSFEIFIPFNFSMHEVNV